MYRPMLPLRTLLRPRKRLVVLTLASAGVAFSAHAGMVVVEQQAKDDVAPSARPTAGLSAEPAIALAAPHAGTTGTAPLPALPVSETALLAGDDSVRPAQPFRSRGSVLDQARALECLTTAIYYEAASEPDDGQRAVAQVVLNRVRHPAFPATVCGVVYQGSERRGCQFSFACDGALARVPARVAWTRARRAAARALAGDVFAPVGLATHYHTYAVTPSWNRSLVMTGVFGAHFFHRWKGWWGTQAGFRDRYAGGEPIPGPHIPTMPAPQAASVVLAPANVIASAAPVPVASATPAAASVVIASENNLPKSEVLDRWKESGTPLR